MDTFPRSRVSSVVEKLKVATQRDRANSTPSLPNTTGKYSHCVCHVLLQAVMLSAVLKARESESFPDFNPAHFAESAQTTPAPPVKPVFVNDPYAHMEASIEDRLDRHDIDLLLDMNRHDEELTVSIPGELKQESHATDIESDDGSCDMDTVQLHKQLNPQSHDQTDGGDIVFTDVEDKVALESKRLPVNKETQGTSVRIVCIHTV